jgi:hypothetical protein
MTPNQSAPYETQRDIGFEYDWTEDDGRIVMSRWNGTQESRWRIAQIEIHENGKIVPFLP